MERVSYLEAFSTNFLLRILKETAQVKLFANYFYNFLYKKLCLYVVSNLYTFSNLTNADSRINFCNVK